MPRSSVIAPPVGALLRRYEDPGEPLSCERVTEGLLNRGYRLATTRGAYFLKHHLDGDRETITRQHHATQRLQALGVPVAPPVADAHGETVAVIGDRCYALHPWIDGRHRDGSHLSACQSRRLGALLGLVHTGLERVMQRAEPPAVPRARSRTPQQAPQRRYTQQYSPQQSRPYDSADPAETLTLIDELLALSRASRPYDVFDALAEHRLLERRSLLERYADHRPPPARAGGWVHGDFHPLNLLYRGTEPAAIVDWDRLGVQPRAEEAVRAAAIFFLRPAGVLELPKVRAYARAYRRAVGADAAEMAAAVHRVWWERLNDFWILRWRYQLRDRRADPQFAAVSALAVWWTREYRAVRDAFTA
ncbi:phosphotransferase [Streptomyces yaizuensis]|uniref:Phosphotransferase n=1 Tax=Streptomyces yaizuensis TaxID=2989713 RepID=A0ABQ5P2E3_9ACTN|nr:phosphotransferase [Streptomyces sp. YSPA8]GLF96650.1 phosphotransferase [Streptomyces sp. YSPA8]